jgi:hypothetical protein
MWTSHGTWRSRSRWSKFAITHLDPGVVLCFTVEFATRQLSLNLIPQRQQERHNLIAKLHESGLSDKEIASELNRRGVLTPTGKAYYAELVFVTRRKLKMRSERHSLPQLTVSEIHFGE